MVLRNQYNFVLFLLSFLLQNGLSIPAYASNDKSCDYFLDSSGPGSDALFDSTLQGLISIQEKSFEVKSELLDQIRRLIKERSLPLKREGLYPVPMINPETLKLMRSWHQVNPGDASYDELEAQILKDPYLTWLKNNWVDMRPNELLRVSVDYSVVPRLDGRTGVFFQGVPKTIIDYLNFHLRYDGPMLLSPEILVLRLMFDHDPKFNAKERDLIYQILSLQKSQFIINTLTKRLAYFEFGNPENWDEFGSYKIALAELQALKYKIKYSLPEYRESNFLQLQNSGQMPRSMSFEDYLASSVLAKSGNPADFQIYERYMLLKNIVRYALLVVDDVAFQDFLDERVESLFPYFLY